MSIVVRDLLLEALIICIIILMRQLGFGSDALFSMFNLGPLTVSFGATKCCSGCEKCKGKEDRHHKRSFKKKVDHVHVDIQDEVSCVLPLLEVLSHGEHS